MKERSQKAKNILLAVLLTAGLIAILVLAIASKVIRYGLQGGEIPN